MSSRKQKRVADKVIRVRETHKEFVQQYIAKVRLERGDVLTEAEALEELFQRVEPELWETALKHTGKRNGNGESHKD
jgi:hypothetical protein